MPVTEKEKELFASMAKTETIKTTGANVQAVEKTAQLNRADAQKSIVEQQTKVVSNKTEKAAVIYNNLSKKGQASVAKQYENFQSAGAKCVKDPSPQNIGGYDNAFVALVQAVQKSKDITDEQKKQFRELYQEFQKEIIPLLLNDNRISNAQNAYFDQEMARKWYEQYYRGKMEEMLISGKIMTDDLVNRLTYTKEAAVEASLALMTGQPISEEAKKVLTNEEKYPGTYALIYTATTNGTSIRESVPVPVKNEN